MNVPALDDAPKTIVVQPEALPAPARSTQRTIGYAVGGVGLVGLVVGTAFGLRALSLKGDRDTRCKGGFCDAEGVAKDHSARTAATVSTVSFIAGSALALGGVVLVLTANNPDRPKVTVGFAPRGLFVGGAF